MARLKVGLDFISKICMAYSFIYSGKNMKTYIENGLDRVSLDEARKAKEIYTALSQIFTDKEICGMANLLQDADERNTFVDVYGKENIIK